MLEVEARCHLVVAGIPCEVVGKAEHLVLHLVVVREELVAEAHIRREVLLDGAVGESLVAVHDVDEREDRRVRTASVLHVCICEEQLVGELFAEAAVEVGSYRCHVVLH